MKKTFFILVFSCFSFLAHAQLLSGGLKAGTNLGTARVSDIHADWENDGITAGIHAGVFGKLNLGLLYVQPEAYYTFTQARLSNTSIRYGTDDLKLDFHRLDIPVMVGFHILDVLRVNAGPFASLALHTNGQSQVVDLEGRAQDFYNRAIWGWQAGIGIDLWRFTLDGRYETTLGDLRNFSPEASTISTYLPDNQQQQQFIISLGIKF